MTTWDNLILSSGLSKLSLIFFNAKAQRIFELRHPPENLWNVLDRWRLWCPKDGLRNRFRVPRKRSSVDSVVNHIYHRRHGNASGDTEMAVEKERFAHHSRYLALGFFLETTLWSCPKLSRLSLIFFNAKAQRGLVLGFSQHLKPKCRFRALSALLRRIIMAFSAENHA